MLKSILNLTGTEELNKTEQKSIGGGASRNVCCMTFPSGFTLCEPGYWCGNRCHWF